MAQDLVPRRNGLTVCLTGAECTGKTTLAGRLAERFGGVMIPEYSRIYAEGAARELTADDVEPIARGQLGSTPPTAGRRPPTIHDTDLISTIVYARHHYGHCPEWIVEEAKARLADLYLLLDIDVPWIADGIRDTGASREQLQRKFIATLRDLGANVVSISGSWEERERGAVAAILKCGGGL